jgi:hypothetical protein
MSLSSPERIRINFSLEPNGIVLLSYTINPSDDIMAYYNGVVVEIKTDKPDGDYLLSPTRQQKFPQGVVHVKRGFIKLHLLCKQAVKHPSLCCFNKEYEITLTKIKDDDRHEHENKHFDLVISARLSPAEISKLYKTVRRNSNALLDSTRINNDYHQYSTSTSFQDEIKIELDNLISEKINGGGPLWVVTKQTNDILGGIKLKLVLDYRKKPTNGRNLQNSNIYTKLGRSTYFSTLHLSTYSIESRTFQRMMNGIFSDTPNTLIYRYNIIIFSSSFQEHVFDLQNVFRKLSDQNLTIDLDKSQFVRIDLNFLGHSITKDEIKADPDRIKVIQNFPLPTNKEQMNRFLAMTGFYSRLIKDYAKVIQPLWRFSVYGGLYDNDISTAVANLKTILSSLSNDCFVLKTVDLRLPFVLTTTDTSDLTFGCVLSQIVAGKELFISYMSSNYSDSETNERDEFAIKMSVKYFRPYLYGTKFTLRINLPLKLSSSLYFALQEYDYTIENKTDREIVEIYELSKDIKELNTIYRPSYIVTRV